MNVLIPPAGRALFMWIVIAIITICQGSFSTATLKSSSSTSDFLHTGLGESLAAASEFCVQWVTYKDPNTGACVPCSPCPDGYMAAVLCEFDRDTLCRPVSDLGRHIESVVHQKVPEGLDSSVDPSWLVQSSFNQEKSHEHQSEIVSMPPTEDTSPLIILVICLSVAFLLSVVLALYCIMKNYRKREVEQNPLDPLKRGLLLDEDEQAENDNEKPPMDLDELLAVRYGRSLVTNNYIL